MNLEIEAEKRQTIENPDDHSIDQALSELQNKPFHAVTLRDDKCFISAFVEQDKFFVTYNDDFGRSYDNRDDLLSKDFAIRMFQLYNRKDSLWKGKIVWEDVTEQIKKQPALIVSVANIMVVWGIIAVIFSFVIRGILGQIMCVAIMSIGIFFIMFGLFLRLLWFRAK